MKVPNDVICGVCKKVFCCAECRYKHEIKSHAIVVQKPKDNDQADGNSKPSKLGEPLEKSETTKIFMFCPLCERKPMQLQRDMYAEMLTHVEQFHLPLRCRKCTKVYNRIDELQDFSKCIYTSIPVSCYPEQGYSTHFDQSCNTVTVQKDLAKVTISTQTSPQRHRNGEFTETPMSLINLRWKAKSKLTQEEFVSDSMSSLKNISSINNNSTRRSLDAIVRPKGQVVRTTSTPVHAELLSTKYTERTFNASGGQVSSIYHSGTESDNHSPAMPSSATALTNAAGVSPSKQHLESINRYLKAYGPRSKMSTVTPLRQVMSKSIQKAFAEHGGLPSTRPGDTDWSSLPKKMFDSQTTDSSNGAVGSPLDLRLSPVVRRSHSEVSMSQLKANSVSAEQKSTMPQSLRHEVLRSAQKLTTTESIVIMRTKHMTSLGVESIASRVSDASKSSDKSTASSSSATSNSSGISSCSASSMYKTCESIKIVTATTALSEIQQDYYAITGEIGNAIEKFVPTMEAMAQVVSSNLPPITPITRIPGAHINKKLIRFDSPCEEEEMENSGEIEIHLDKESDDLMTKAKPPHKYDLSYGSPKHNNTTNSGSKISLEKVVATPNSTEYSVAETFFTPNATPMCKNKKQSMIENSHKSEDFNRVQLFRPPSLRKSGRSATFDHSKSKNEETPPAAASRREVTQKTSSGLGRSWSFNTLLGSVMRLNSKGKGPAVGKAETPPREEAISDSFIKRCASVAGSLIRTQSLIDEEEQITQKRKRSNTTDMKSFTSLHHQRNNSGSVSPRSDSSLGTKRFRIQGRKPIERMRKDN